MRALVVLCLSALVVGCGDEHGEPGWDLAGREAGLPDANAPVPDASVDGACISGTCPETCLPPAIEVCGNCGTRACSHEGRWSPCAGEGPCAPGETSDCGPDGTMTCAATCGWGACLGASSCVNGEVAACGNCGATACSAARWGACVGAGPCERGAQQACGDCSVRECDDGCQWGECRSLCSDDEVCSAGACVPRPRSLDGGVADLARAPDLRPPDAGTGCMPAGTDAPLLFYYGIFHNSKTDRRYDDKLNHGLIVPGLDVTFTVSGASDLSDGAGDASRGKPESGEFKQFHDKCAHLAYNLGLYRLALCLLEQDGTDNGKPLPDPCAKTGDGVESTARFIEDRFADGWDYISIDEIKHTHGIAFDNGSTLSKRLVSLFKRLEKGGHNRRMIFWFSPRTTDVTRSPSASGTDNLAQYTDLLDACQTYCRKLVFETYPSLRTSTIMTGSADHLDDLAARLHKLKPGTNRVAMAGIGVGNLSTFDMQDMPDCDLAPYKGGCGGRDGGLQRLFNQMHGSGSSRYWWGAGFYVLGSVEGHGPWNRQDFVDFLASRTRWWVGKQQP